MENDNKEKKIRIETEKVFVHGGFGKRTQKTDQNKLGWEEGFYDLDKINPEKKTILYLGGNGTVQAGHANFGCKFVEGLVGKAIDNNFDLFGFYYSHEETRKRYIETKTGNPLLDENGQPMETFDYENGGFTEEDLAKTYNSFVSPLFLKDGKLLSEEEIAKNLGNLRIFAYCKGSEETNKLLQAANEFLSEKFGEEKSKSLLENVFVVHFAPWKEPIFGTNVEFKSLRDIKTKEPWIASKEGWGFCKDEPFTGVAQTCFNKAGNAVEVFSNSFVSVEDLLGDNPFDPHSIANFLKIDGVVDRAALPGFEHMEKQDQQELLKLKKEGKAGKKPKGYSRQQAISDLMSSALSYGLVFDKPNLNEVKMSLDACLNQENRVFYEQKQKEIFESQQNLDETQTAKENSKTLEKELGQA